ncbi:predicted protein [Sclerotinia sclerotiorum 1980 UF-70]|uniref:Uncharacterized protein n=1 Tax=Sclerotinia sclerotiorum (strain ATCC 18683 / 1980 / Ss-1) TaxID=665079 RepID=A7EQP6_SCLS1|nr:predicted protein [Sclerotinia sclerotiorum 1980 UF-70]EDN91788.1 predicted protein [Sclerotinia sclerotiorum 1980 UF-70]
MIVSSELGTGGEEGGEDPDGFSYIEMSIDIVGLVYFGVGIREKGGEEEGKRGRGEERRGEERRGEERRGEKGREGTG